MKRLLGIAMTSAILLLSIFLLFNPATATTPTHHPAVHTTKHHHTATHRKH